MAVSTDTPTQSVGAENTQKDVAIAGLIAEAGALAEGGHPLGGFFSRLVAFLETI